MTKFPQLSFIILMAFWIGKGSAQTTAFNWSDTIFKVETRREIEMFIDQYGGPCSIDPCYDNNQKVYDTLISFLKSHTSIKIQIASYLDSGVGSQVDNIISTQEAKYIGIVLIRNGINDDRITTVGYGNSKPIIKDVDITKLTKKEQDQVRDKNTRIEVIITAN